jgi:ferrous iron transport protein A
MRRTLAHIPPGQGGTVAEVATDELSAKLVEMGLYPGKEVKVLFRAPLGDPIAVDVEGYVLSLRMDEAILIHLDTPA